MMNEPNMRTNSSSSHSCELRRGPWMIEEDNLLVQYITLNGEGRWNSLAKSAGLNRTGKSCRLRWLNYLKPDIKRGNLSPHEQLLILELHSKWGNRWSRIAQQLPGRTDNEIKNYWRTRVQRQARQLQLDSNSDKFLEIVRAFWQPAISGEHYSSPSVADKPLLPSSCSLVTNPEVDEMARQQMTMHGGADVQELECHLAQNNWMGEDFPWSCTFWDTADRCPGLAMNLF